jgi:hypothetical protein
MWWFTSAIPAFGKMKQKFEASLGYITRVGLSQKKKDKVLR